MKSFLLCCQEKTGWFHSLVLRLCELRADKATGKNAFVGEARVDVKNFIEKSDGNFSQEYEVGGIYGIRKFCRIHGIRAQGPDEMNTAVEERFGFTVAKSKAGTLSVYWPNDPNPNTSDFRYKRGVESSSKKTVKKEYAKGDEDVLEEDFEEAARSDCEADADEGNCDENISDAPDGEDAFSADDDNDNDEIDDDEDGDGDGDDAHDQDNDKSTVASSKKKSWPPEAAVAAGKQTPKKPSSLPGSSSAPPRTSGTSVSESQHQQSEEPVDEDSDAKSKKPKPGDKFLGKGHVLLQRVAKTASPEVQWGPKKLRGRDHKNLLSVLNGHGGACSVKIGQDKVVDMGTQLMAAAAVIDDRRDLFHQMSVKPIDFVDKKLEYRDKEIIRTCSPELLLSIFYSMATSMSGTAEGIVGILTMAQYQPDLTRFNAAAIFPSGVGDHSGNARTLEKLQKSLVQIAIDKAIEYPVPSIIDMVDEVVKRSGFIPMKTTHVNTGEDAPPTIAKEGNFGWCGQAYLDLSCLVVTGKILREKNSGATTIVGALRNQAAVAWTNRDSLSMRTKTLTKARGRNQTNNMKVAWDWLAELWPSGPPDNGTLVQQAEQLAGEGD